MDSENRYTPETAKNVVEIETAHAKYQIIYGAHEIEQTPKVIEDSDGLIVEGLAKTTTPKEVIRTIQIMKKIPQHSRLIEYCQTQGKPLYLVDLNAVGLNYEQMASFLNSCEFTSGALLGTYALSDVLKRYILRKQNKDPKVNRRDFLQKIATGTKAVAATYLLSPVIGEKFAQSLGQPEEGTLGRTIDRALTQLNESIHPELFRKIVTFRNNLIAEKSEHIAEQLKKEKGTKPRLSILLGAAHIGIESALKKTEEERVAEMSEDIGDNNLLKQPSIVRVDFRGGEIIPTFMEEEDIKKIF